MGLRKTPQSPVDVARTNVASALDAFTAAAANLRRQPPPSRKRSRPTIGSSQRRRPRTRTSRPRSVRLGQSLSDSSI